METRKAKKAIMLALDVCGGRGRFSKRSVAIEAHRMVKYEDLSLADQTEAMINFYMREATNQMRVRLGMDAKAYLANIPNDVAPIMERLPKAICVTPRGGAAPEFVFAIYANPEDLRNYRDTIKIMREKLRGADHAVVAAIRLLEERGAGSIYEIITGQKIERQPYIKGPKGKPDDDDDDEE